MKICFKCGKEKPLKDYYEHKQMLDGHLNKCKECTKSDVANNREKNIDRVREYDRIRGKLPHRLKGNRDRSRNATKEQKASTRDARKRWEKRNPEKAAKSKIDWKKRNKHKRLAQIAVGNAIRDKRINRPDRCDVCGIKCTPQGHHHDYNKPLDVMWLCTECHGKAHWKQTG